SGKPAKSSKNDLWTEYETVAMNKAQASGLAVYHVVVKIDPHCAMPIAGRQLIHNALAALGQIIAVRPDAKSPAASKLVEFVLATSHPVEQISAKGRIPTIAEEVNVELLLAAAVVAPDTAEAVPAHEPLPAEEISAEAPATHVAAPSATAAQE